MGEEGVTNWIAVYGAALSTIIAVAALVRWWLSGDRLSVHVFNPNDFWLGSGNFGFAVSNSGTSPVVVREVRLDFLSDRSRRGQSVGVTIFNQRSRWNPATKNVPDPNKPNTSHLEPRILNVGEELHGIGQPVEGYNPEVHWIKATAFARNSDRAFVGFASPMKALERGEAL